MRQRVGGAVRQRVGDAVRRSVSDAVRWKQVKEMLPALRSMQAGNLVYSTQLSPCAETLLSAVVWVEVYQVNRSASCRGCVAVRSTMKDQHVGRLRIQASTSLSSQAIRRPPSRLGRGKSG